MPEAINFGEKICVINLKDKETKTQSRISKLKTPDTACSNPVFRAATSMSGVFRVEPQQRANRLAEIAKHVRGFRS